ncbi:unnamed protein product [Brachionus calyciflorus]|uniref:EGF-like domain-containing protein n=1 Tax=Brachionus calyciflorus TaxID=104777 RepID=A0A814MBN4_9BILA|nr:unnamed protein product [Brachionus calyciflorus]
MIKEIEYLFFLSLLRLIQVFRCQSLYVTGSDDNSLKIWNDSLVILSKNISRKVTCLDIDYNRNIILAGTHNGKVVGWDVQSDSLIFDNGNETNKVNSILIINSTHLLAGYNGFIIFWALPQISQIKKINDVRFGTIGEMKNLIADNLVLIINVETKMVVFSLNNNSILKENNIVEEGFSFDLINRSFIFAPCGIISTNDFCLYSLTSSLSLIQSNISDFRTLNFLSLKILNETFGIYSTSNCHFGFVNFQNKNLIKNYSLLSNIRSIDVLNDRIVASYQNGSISHFDKNNFTLIKTFQGNSLGLSLNVIKKILDFSLFQNKYSTMIEYASTTFKNDTVTQYVGNKNTFENIETINLSFKSSTVSLFTNHLSNPNVTNSIEDIFDRFSNSLVTSSYLTNKKIEYFDLYRIKNNKILELLQGGMDLNDCISNCSGNGYCKLVNSIELICECFENFAGKKCDINTLPCFSNKCKNNSSCVNNFKNKTYTCECITAHSNKSLYYGNYCENKIDLCENETCSHNGVCIDTGTEPKCKCFSKFSGGKCEIESNEIIIIKIVMRSASLIAIIILIMSACLIIFFDLSKLFDKEKQKKKHQYRDKVYRIHKFKYVH